LRSQLRRDGPADAAERLSVVEAASIKEPPAKQGTTYRPALLRARVLHAASKCIHETRARCCLSVAGMLGPWLDRPYTFRALRKTFGQMWVRCDVCRRYARFRMLEGLGRRRLSH
jgi:hypothetical protein